MAIASINWLVAYTASLACRLCLATVVVRLVRLIGALDLVKCLRLHHDLRKMSFSFSTFHMFVTSLSWQSDRFFGITMAQKGVFLAASSDSVTSLLHIKSKRYGSQQDQDGTVANKKNRHHPSTVFLYVRPSQLGLPQTNSNES